MRASRARGHPADGLDVESRADRTCRHNPHNWQCPPTMYKRTPIGRMRDGNDAPQGIARTLREGRQRAVRADHGLEAWMTMEEERHEV
jgi:hypothetical protein